MFNATVSGSAVGKRNDTVLYDGGVSMDNFNDTVLYGMVSMDNFHVIFTCVLLSLSSSTSRDSIISDASSDSFRCCNWLIRLSYRDSNSALDSSTFLSCN